MSQLIGSGKYHWWQYYNDRHEQLRDHLEEVFAILKDAGIRAWEHTIESEDEAALLGSLLPRYGLELPSIYVSGRLHEDDWEDTAKVILQQAKWGKSLGARIVVINPDPLSWNEPVDKTDDQLRCQAAALVALTNDLAASGLKLAYHTHSPEMRQAARELHHMLLATREAGMGFCLDFHWLYRGAGNSQIALEDLVELYGDRVVTTHIRQSNFGIWSESLEDGDINYVRLAARLKAAGYQGPLIIECARESGTAIAPSMLEAYRASREWLESVFED